MKKNSFIRMSGAHNTFWFADSMSMAKLSTTKKKQIAKRLCAGYYGLKTDGLIFLKSAKGFDFTWDFYNSDGSNAEMCGNAARCAIHFYFHRIKKKKLIRFQTTAGEIQGTVIGKNKVQVLMTEISKPKKMNVLGVDGVYVNTGVPHFVINQQPSTELAVRLRAVSDFGAAGANITFAANLTEKSIRAVTFERGVEDFTQACGTGAVAAAMFLQEQTGPKKKISVHMPGGELVVENAQAGNRPYLIGGAVFEIEARELGEKA